MNKQSFIFGKDYTNKNYISEGDVRDWSYNSNRCRDINNLKLFSKSIGKKLCTSSNINVTKIKTTNIKILTKYFGYIEIRALYNTNYDYCTDTISSLSIPQYIDDSEYQTYWITHKEFMRHFDFTFDYESILDYCSDRYGYSYNFIGTLFGYKCLMDVDVSLRRVYDICISGSIPNCHYVKNISKNIYIDPFIELYWQPKHQQFLPKQIMKNPYV